jgi:hypothetical protein
MSVQALVATKVARLCRARLLANHGSLEMPITRRFDK